MNYHWNWGVLWQSTGVGHEIYLNWLWRGILDFFALGITAWIIACVLGTILGIMRCWPSRTARGIATAYVVLFRNTPLMVQIFFWFYVAPTLFGHSFQQWWNGYSLSTSAFISASIGLGLFTSSRLCELWRAGIDSLPKGQLRAAYALGFTTRQAFRKILLPQAVRIIMPPLSSELANCFKNVAIASLVGVPELLSQIERISEYTQATIEIYTYATIIYFVMTFALIMLVNFIDKMIRIPGKSMGGQ